MMQYKYITDNNLENKQKYMYSEYGGYEFIQSYKASRKDVIELCSEINLGGHVTRQDFGILKDSFMTGRVSESEWDLLNAYTKSFEVRKLVYTEYDKNWKPEINAVYDENDLYLLLSELMILAYRSTKCTKYLSCMLKVDDTMISVVSSMTASEKKELEDVLRTELDLVDDLADKMDIEDWI